MLFGSSLLAHVTCHFPGSKQMQRVSSAIIGKPKDRYLP